MNIKANIVLVNLLTGLAYGQVNIWGQCGGIGYTGGTLCIAGSTCSTFNPYYAQCLPGGPTATSTTLVYTTATTTASLVSLRTMTSPTRTTSTVSLRTTTSSTRTTTTTPPLPTGNLGSTLISPYLWIRAVVAPYYHKYLQSSPIRSPGDAVMGEYTTAGQFDISDNQLVQLISTSGTLLYAKIEEKTSDSQTKLQLTWQSTPSSYGTFSWSGDALLWKHPTITRQNDAAWLICDGAKLHANLGAYGWNTPAGCSDATIHYYNGATAVDK
ncbi:hypothetical protein TWF730_001314 [Orbilia blumenaviensis]|uniref:CBM1 domain-containing protein n=1 Tax=Orbilia blumenaviensis TaxID=1796055 RepID=A0AAV9UH77_9PEZI